MLELSKQEQGGRNAYSSSSASKPAATSSSSSSAQARGNSSSSYSNVNANGTTGRDRDREVAPVAPEVPSLNQATRVRALYAYTPTNPTELALQAGDIIKVIGRTYDQWWRGTLRGRVGCVSLVLLCPCLLPSRAIADRPRHVLPLAFSRSTTSRVSQFPHGRRCAERGTRRTRSLEAWPSLTCCSRS